MYIIDVSMRIVYDSGEYGLNHNCGGKETSASSLTASGSVLTRYPITGILFIISLQRTTVMIQTGHSKGGATEDEMKIWANLFII